MTVSPARSTREVENGRGQQEKGRVCKNVVLTYSDISAGALDGNNN